MNRLIGYVKLASFHLRWPLMSPKERYPYLWARTKKLGDLGHAVQNTAVVEEVIQ